MIQGKSIKNVMLKEFPHNTSNCSFGKKFVKPNTQFSVTRDMNKKSSIHTTNKSRALYTKYNIRNSAVHVGVRPDPLAPTGYNVNKNPGAPPRP